MLRNQLHLAKKVFKNIAFIPKYRIKYKTLIAAHSETAFQGAPNLGASPKVALSMRVLNFRLPPPAPGAPPPISATVLLPFIISPFIISFLSKNTGLQMCTFYYISLIYLLKCLALVCFLLKKLKLLIFSIYINYISIIEGAREKIKKRIHQKVSAKK